MSSLARSMENQAVGQYGPRTEQFSFQSAFLDALQSLAKAPTLSISGTEATASGFVARSTSMADVTGRHAFLFPVDVMMTITHELLMTGQSVWRLGEQLEWVQGFTYTAGGQYILTDNRAFPPSQILHVRYLVDRISKHGIAPLSEPVALRNGLRRLERAMSEVADARVGTLVTVPAGSFSQEKTDELKKLVGGLMVNESSRSWGSEDSKGNPYQEFQLSPKPDATAVTLLEKLRAAALTTMGAPSSLIDGRVSREDYRLFLHTTLEPLGRIIVGAARSVGLEISIDWSKLFASDGVSKSRIYGSLRQAGMSDGEARKLAGYPANGI